MHNHGRQPCIARTGVPQPACCYVCAMLLRECEENAGTGNGGVLQWRACDQYARAIELWSVGRRVGKQQRGRRCIRMPSGWPRKKHICIWRPPDMDVDKQANLSRGKRTGCSELVSRHSSSVICHSPSVVVYCLPAP